MLIAGSATLEATKGHRIVAITLPVHELRGVSCISRSSVWHAFKHGRIKRNNPQIGKSAPRNSNWNSSSRWKKKKNLPITNGNINSENSACQPAKWFFVYAGCRTEVADNIAFAIVAHGTWKWKESGKNCAPSSPPAKTGSRFVIAAWIIFCTTAREIRSPSTSSR